MYTILIIEDDKNISTGLVDNLEMEGYKAIVARDGASGLALAQKENPDLIVLDIMLPKLNGLEVCRQLKKLGNNTPIIILSAKAQESDKVLGLEIGADDYITKPFSPNEFIVRVKAVLRRSVTTQKTEDTFEFDDIKIDFKRFQVFKKGVELKLTADEFKILKLLIANKGVPLSRHKILAEFWSEEVTSRTVDTHVWSLREKLEADPAHPVHIVTVHRIGYKFV